MSGDREHPPGLADLDPFIHTPARLRILALLGPVRWVTFAYLRETVGTSDSALSKQLSALQAAGYIETWKDRSHGHSTLVSFTDDGRNAFNGYLRTLERIVALARSGPAATEGQVG